MGGAEIQLFFKHLHRPTHTWSQIRVMVIGKQGCGKTSIIKGLLSGTQGIQRDIQIDTFPFDFKFMLKEEKFRK